MATHEILPIKRNQFHFCKFHIFCNPDHYMMHEYLSCHWKWPNDNKKKIKIDHHIHIFIGWITQEEIDTFVSFVSMLGQKSQYKVTIHIPKYSDEHTAILLRKALDSLLIKGKYCFKVVAEFRQIVSFNMFDVDGNDVLQLMPDRMYSFTWRHVTTETKDYDFTKGWFK